MTPFLRVIPCPPRAPFATQPASAGEERNTEVTTIVETVVKLGGGVLAHPEHFHEVLAEIGDAARESRLLVVPGGGPFADTVREVDRRYGLSDDAAHWMAVLAMDQHASVVVSRLTAGVLVADGAEIGAALNDGQVPVLAPSRWLRETDPLPHSWDVTSDSIAAWVAGQVGARRLVLVKPPGLLLSDDARDSRLGATLASLPASALVDVFFARTLPADVEATIVPADRIDALRSALNRWSERTGPTARLRDRGV